MFLLLTLSCLSRSIFDGDTKQRKISHLNIPRGIAPAQVSVVRAGDTTDALLRVEWADAEPTTSVFPAQWQRRQGLAERNEASRWP